MEDKNELNDIILNKGNSTSSNKKIILAVATLGIILVIVVMLMNSLSSSGTDNLPQAALPPKPAVTAAEPVDEPLFEDVEVVHESTPEANKLDRIAQKLKQESQEQADIEITPTVTPVTPKVVEAPKKIIKAVVKKHISKQKVVKKSVTHDAYYVQVGSFSKYAPNKKFLKSITDLNYQYTYHKVKKLNKVLIGPFTSKRKAQNARRIIRAKIEPGAFLIKL